MGSRNSAWNWKCLWTINYFSNVLLFQWKAVLDKWSFPDGEVSEGTEKINLKNLHKTFKDTKFHGLVSIQFLYVLGKFFGLDIPVPKNAITELYKNLSYKTLSGARNLEFSAVSDLILEISFQIKRSTLLNRKRKEEDEKINVKIKEEHDFFLTTWWIWGGTGRGPV